jgi:hypothetical protein
VTFIASPDHNTIVNGTAVLSSYRIDVYNGATVASSKDCGKPVPAVVGGTPNVVTCTGVTVPNNVSLTVKAVAVGPGGETAGAASDPFGNVAAPGAPGKPTVQ